MTDNQLIHSLHAIAAATALLGLAWLYQRYRIDRFRNELFAVRDELFLFAAQNNLINDPGYRELRKVFNGMLRFCHRLTFMQLMLAPVSAGSEPFQEWLSLIGKLPNAQRDQLISYHFRMLEMGMRFVILGSPLGWLLVLKYWIMVAIRHGSKALLRPLVHRWLREWQAIEKQALET